MPKRFPECSLAAHRNKDTNEEAALALRVCPRQGSAVVKANEYWEIAKVLKPVAPVGEPPTESEDGDRRADSPPEGQKKIGRKTESAENHPKDFALHAGLKKILTPRAAPRK